MPFQTHSRSRHWRAFRAGLVVTLILALVGLPVQAQRLAWSAVSPGAEGDPIISIGTSGQSTRPVVAVDSQGAVYAAMNVDHPNDRDVLVAKYAPDGALVWSSTFHGTGHSFVSVVALRLSPDGNAMVLVEGEDAAFVVVKFAALNGAQMWLGKYRENGANASVPRHLVVDAAGAAIVSGTSGDTSNGLAVKFHGEDGHVQWAVQTPMENGGCAVALSAAGELTLLGRGRTAPSFAEFVAMKLASDGQQAWLRTFDSTTQLSDCSATSGADGDVVFAGVVAGPVAATVALRAVRLAATDGHTVWSQTGATLASGNTFALRTAGADTVLLAAGEHVPGVRELVAVKYRGSDGTEVWNRRFGAGAGVSDTRGERLAVSAAGDVLIASSGMFANEVQMVQLAGGTGNVNWQQSYQANAGLVTAHAVAVAPDGAMVVAGAFTNTANPDLVLLKYSSAGAPLWVAREPVVTTIPSYVSCGQERRQSALVDAAGATFVTGCERIGARTTMVTTKFAADGSVQWTTHHAGLGTAGSAYGVALALDPAGDVVVTGASTAASNVLGFVTIKYRSADGAVLWLSRLAGMNALDARAAAVTVDLHGDVLVTGTQDVALNSPRIWTVKYLGANGQEQWTALDAEEGNSWGVGIRTDASGDVIVGGTTRVETQADFLVLKYRRSDGQRLWRARYDGPASREDIAYAFAVDGDGNALVNGSSRDESTFQLATVKFDGATGTRLWAVRTADDGVPAQPLAQAMALDSAGDVVVVGRQGFPGPDVDLTAWKYRGSDGMALWMNHVSWPGSSDDHANSVVIDRSGDVIAAGVANSNAQQQYVPSDFTAAKFSGATGDVAWTFRHDFGATGEDVSSNILLAEDGSVRIAGSVFSVAGPRMGVLKLVQLNGELFVDGFE